MPTRSRPPVLTCCGLAGAETATVGAGAGAAAPVELAGAGAAAAVGGGAALVGAGAAGVAPLPQAASRAAEAVENRSWSAARRLSGTETPSGGRLCVISDRLLHAIGRD